MKARASAMMRVRVVIAGFLRATLCATQDAAPARHRVADDKVVAWNVREAAEVRRIGEAVVAGGEALVASGGHGEAIADAERFGRLLPQLDQHAVERDAVRLHLDREAFA